MHLIDIEKGAIVDRKGASDALGLDARVVGKLVSGGWLFPVDAPPGIPENGPKRKRMFFRLTDVINARIEQVLEHRIGEDPSNPMDARQARARRDSASADLLELRLKTEMGELISRDEVLEVNSRILAAARAKFLLFPSVWSDRAHKAAKTKGPSGVEKVLQTAVDEVLTELSGMKKKGDHGP